MFITKKHDLEIVLFCYELIVVDNSYFFYLAKKQ